MSNECSNIFDAIKPELEAEIASNPEIWEAKFLLQRIDAMPEWAKDLGDAIIRGSHKIVGAEMPKGCERR